MPDHVLKEEPLQFGEGGRLFGILTVPNTPKGQAPELPVFVFLTAGFLHRVGPLRLHVRLARELAGMGFSSLRVDMAGTGDTPPRPASMSYQQSVVADFKGIVDVLDSRLGRPSLVLAGLCSGADNAIMLAIREPRVVGMVLLDPICFPEAGFRAREIFQKYTSPARFVSWLRRRLKAPFGAGVEREDGFDPQAWRLWRELPTLEELRVAFESIRSRGGRVLSVFTGQTLQYYNQRGQLGRVLGVEGYSQFCTERFWPEVEHTYSLELHRRRLMAEIRPWALSYIRS
jgi:pimeloyl-ACP methyl ester carboxylesterase